MLLVDHSLEKCSLCNYNRNINRKLKLRKKIKKINNPFGILEFNYIIKECPIHNQQCNNDYIERIETKIKEHPKIAWTPHKKPPKSL